jgi:hypothetical protein
MELCVAGLDAARREPARLLEAVPKAPVELQPDHAFDEVAHNLPVPIMIANSIQCERVYNKF